VSLQGKSVILRKISPSVDDKDLAQEKMLPFWGANKGAKLLRNSLFAPLYSPKLAIWTEKENKEGI